MHQPPALCSPSLNYFPHHWVDIKTEYITTESVGAIGMSGFLCYGERSAFRKFKCATPVATDGLAAGGLITDDATLFGLRVPSAGNDFYFFLELYLVGHVASLLQVMPEVYYMTSPVMLCCQILCSFTHSKKVAGSSAVNR